MNRNDDFDRTLQAWLHRQAPPEAPDRVLVTALERVATESQRPSWPMRLFGGITVNSMVRTGAVAAVVASAVLIGLQVSNLGSVRNPSGAGDPPSPFEGTWISTTDSDGGTQVMTVAVSTDGAVEFFVVDDNATVCSATPSTMIGFGRFEGTATLVIPAPEYRCDDGSEPQALSGPPLHEQLRNLTFVHDAASDTLTDNFRGLWVREGAEGPGPGPAITGAMWPQASLEEVQAAQERADAGAPDYAWQVDPRLSTEEWWSRLRQPGAEIVNRFLQDALGWDRFLFNPYVGDDGDGAAGGIRGVVYLRCGPGETNPLYPTAPVGHQEAPGAERCAPTLDELRYETVRLDLIQPAGQGPSGLWVVSGWTTIAPFAQTDPTVADTQATARLDEFLRARLSGEGAEGLVEVAQSAGALALEDVPLLYATTTGAPYERYEIERVTEPMWPYAEMEFVVRLFADGGATVVEQPIAWRESGGADMPFVHDAGETTENGQPIALPFEFFDGLVTMTATPPWRETWANNEGLILDRDNLVERLALVTDPLPAATGCEPGTAVADAEALAEAVRSDPDLEATAPVALSVGGSAALWMDVVAAPGASVCERWPATMVLTDVPLEQGSRMRLYLIDLPDGSPAGVLVIAVVASEARFDSVIEVATPVVESLELNTP